MFTFDTSTEFGARVERRLRNDQIAWLTTEGTDGIPEPSPIWFLWDGTSILIFSQRNKPKLRNIAANPNVAFNLNSNDNGGDVIVITGRARIDQHGSTANEYATYSAKYAEAMIRLGATPEAFAQEYSVAIRVTPERLRGH